MQTDDKTDISELCLRIERESRHVYRRFNNNAQRVDSDMVWAAVQLMSDAARLTTWLKQREEKGVLQ